jgi:CheY-like chemotaxis protein
MAKTVMVVDDEDSLLELLRAVLEASEYKVITAQSGEECLKKLKTVRPDLVLLDMMMPGMSGREVCEKIRADPRTKSLKVAFVTVAKFSESGKEKLKEMNVSDYITKPFDNADLIARVRKIVGG